MIYPGTYSLTLRESKETRLSVEEMDENFKFLNNLTNPKYKVYTALLTQSGGDNLQRLIGTNLTIGVTYRIIQEYSNSGDFTNVGAPNNNDGTMFVATGITPNSWGDNLLEYNTGAPVATVLENTIGNIWFTYDIVGSYYANSNSLFTNNKSTIIVGNPYWETSNGFIKSGFDGESFANIKTSDFSNTGIDDNTLINTPIEIRVYN